jgi:hypothetical protein
MEQPTAVLLGHRYGSLHYRAGVALSMTEHRSCLEGRLLIMS